MKKFEALLQNHFGRMFGWYGVFALVEKDFRKNSSSDEPFDSGKRLDQ